MLTFFFVSALLTEKTSFSLRISGSFTGCIGSLAGLSIKKDYSEEGEKEEIPWIYPN
jgi:hypothetical protein